MPARWLPPLINRHRRDLICSLAHQPSPSPHDFSGTYGPFSVGSATFTMDGKGNAYGYVCIKAIDSDCSNVSGASVVDIRNRVDDCPNGLRPEVDSETCTVNWGTLSITSSTGCAGATIPTKSFRINGSC